MSFLENDGDIILDVVLTDTGRARLAKGDGSFKINKFAVFDDEINYALYNGVHPSGSAYFDLDILSTPVLEALTNNTSFGKSKLISIARNDLLYLPIIKLGQNLPGGGSYNGDGYFVVSVNENTSEAFKNDSISQGILNGETRDSAATTLLTTEQGLDTTDISRKRELSSDLVESQYIIEIDSRLGELVDRNGTVLDPSYIDDDKIAFYIVTLATNPEVVEKINNDSIASTIAGPRGTRCSFSIRANININTSSSLYSKIGATGWVVSSSTYSYIDSVVRVTGGNTGNRLDIPVRFARKA